MIVLVVVIVVGASWLFLLLSRGCFQVFPGWCS